MHCLAAIADVLFCVKAEKDEFFNTKCNGGVSMSCGCFQ